MALVLDNFGVVPLVCLSGITSASVTLLTAPADIFQAQTALSEVSISQGWFAEDRGLTSVAFVSEVTFANGEVLDITNFLPTFEFAFATSVTFALQTSADSTARGWASLTNYKVV